MKASLSILSDFKTRGRKIAVLSDMLELGPDSPEYHKEVGRFIATTKVTDLFITGELSKNYIEEAWKENPSLGRHHQPGKQKGQGSYGGEGRREG